MTKDYLEIKTSNYVSQINKISNELIYLEREHHYTQGFETVDTFGDFSVLAVADLKEGSVVLSIGEESISLNGPVALYVPKYSVIKWNISTPVLKWSAYITRQSLSDHLKTVTVLTEFDRPVGSIDDLKEIILHSTIQYSFSKANEQHLDLQIKLFLDQNQTEHLEINQVGAYFGLTSSQVTKIFKKQYAITPVDYRSKVRIFNSMINLLMSQEKKDVTKIALDSGFADLSRFNKQFKKITRTTPSRFKFRTKY